MVRRRQLHKQERLNTCAVAALRTVLDLQFRLKVAEQALEALGTDAHEPIKTHGTTNRQLRRMVRGASQAFNTARPWTCWIREHCTMEQLDTALQRGRFPLVTVYGLIDGDETYHMIVVLGIRTGRVRVWDPDDARGEPYWIDELEFLAWWTDPAGRTEMAVIGGG